jgi:hypothetical protein
MPCATALHFRVATHFICGAFAEYRHRGLMRINLGKRGITSFNIGKTNFRKGYTLRTSIRLFPGLSWFFGGKRKSKTD